ncbi:hypothetical protein [Reyranella sp.]|uniref:hypothetical protein n=1 Tax=Reyranella sp. TaxID=1929291 RepID=UPI004035A972
MSEKEDQENVMEKAVEAAREHMRKWNYIGVVGGEPDSVRFARALLSSSERVKELERALKAAAETCQVFLDDCGDVRDFTTQADINDWLELLKLLPTPRS